jgi:hypothetical protein
MVMLYPVYRIAKLATLRAVVERWDAAIAAGQDVWWSPTICAEILAVPPV